MASLGPVHAITEGAIEHDAENIAYTMAELEQRISFLKSIHSFRRFYLIKPSPLNPSTYPPLFSVVADLNIIA